MNETTFPWLNRSKLPHHIRQTLADLDETMLANRAAEEAGLEELDAVLRQKRGCRR